MTAHYRPSAVGSAALELAYRFGLPAAAAAIRLLSDRAVLAGSDRADARARAAARDLSADPWARSGLTRLLAIDRIDYRQDLAWAWALEAVRRANRR